MLSDSEFEEWCTRLNLSEEARAAIKRIRSSPPARRVQSGSGNVTVYFNRSTKMPHTIQAESRSVEFAAILVMEFPGSITGVSSDDVIEIWDQPPSFVVNYKASTGKTYGYVYTADFFVLRENSAGWEEWKTEKELIEFSENQDRYYLDEKGRWHYRPGEQYAEALGLYFHAHSSKEINPMLLRNAQLLLPCWRKLMQHNG